MKKYICEVTRIDTYEIEIDESIIDEKWMADFRGSMYNFKTLEEHAEHLAKYRARNGEEFIEGYGYPNIDGEIPFEVKYYNSNKDSWCNGININIVSEDDDIEVYTKEVE